VRPVAAAFAVTLAALATAACGSGAVGLPEQGNTSAGKTQFTAKCGSCHTLADAGTAGKIGPDLDAAFEQSRKDGIGEGAIAGIVRAQIAYPVSNPVTGKPGMPADLVTGQDADDVATYVASVAGTGATPPATTGGGTTTTGGGGGTTTGGGGGGGAEVDGKAVFASAGCGSCHTLADAGSAGTIGPNLDEAKPSKELALERVTNGKAPMPSFKGQLSEAQIEAVAEYVSSVAGK
jgi:mono/diheme cytochrome c family protein